MEEVLSIVILGRACRNGANIKNRQPIGKMYVKSEEIKDMPEFYSDIIKEELNVKEILFTDDVRHFTTYSFKPQLKTLGKRFGKDLNTVREILSSLDGNKAMDELNEKGTLTININGNDEALTKEDLLIDSAQMPGYESVEDRGITVVLDTNLSEELIEEGFVREVISKIQNMRKDSGFEVMDHIDLYVSGNDKVAEIIKRNETEILQNVLGEAIVYGEACENSKEWSLNGEKVILGVVRK